MVLMIYESLSRFQRLEFSFLWYVQSSLRTKSLDIFMASLSKLGNIGLIWFLLSFILYLDNATKAIAFAIVLGLVVHVFVCNLLLKNIFARSRPDLSASRKNFRIEHKDYSFPSGHTCSAFIVAAILYYFSSPYVIAVLPLATLMGFSRIYLGAHYPSDVVVGAIIGWIIGYFVYYGGFYTI